MASGRIRSFEIYSTGLLVHMPGVQGKASYTIYPLQLIHLTGHCSYQCREVSMCLAGVDSARQDWPANSFNVYEIDSLIIRSTTLSLKLLSALTSQLAPVAPQQETMLALVLWFISSDMLANVCGAGWNMKWMVEKKNSRENNVICATMNNGFDSTQAH